MRKYVQILTKIEFGSDSYRQTGLAGSQTGLAGSATASAENLPKNLINSFGLQMSMFFDQFDEMNAIVQSNHAFEELALAGSSRASTPKHCCFV
jgi:hypothetical protein